MKHGDLFAGIGGFSLAARWIGWKTVFHCEKEDYKRKELGRNFPESTSYGDITTTDFTIHRGTIDVLTGGFPCQDASKAKQDGKGQKGLRGSRTGLFYHMCRAIDEIRPKAVVAENVANILETNGGADFMAILSELAAMGYDAEWRVCRASDVGAPHHRERLYLVAYTDGYGLQEGETFFSHVHETPSPFAWRTNGAAIQINRAGAWNSEPPPVCLDNGFSSGLVRKQLHGYGNAVVPQIPFAIFKAIQSHANTLRT